MLLPAAINLSDPARLTDRRDSSDVFPLNSPFRPAKLYSDSPLSTQLDLGGAHNDSQNTEVSLKENA